MTPVRGKANKRLPLGALPVMAAENPNERNFYRRALRSSAAINSGPEPPAFPTPAAATPPSPSGPSSKAPRPIPADKASHPHSGPRPTAETERILTAAAPDATRHR